MSSARSNAAARNRRAGEPLQQQQQQPGRPMQPPGQMRGQYQSQQQSQQQQQPPQQAKLSLSDAIGLITLRLGRVETIVQNIQTGDGYENTGSGELPDNMRVIDESVFTSIVSRLDQLETGHKQVLVKLSQKPVSVSAPVPAQPVQAQSAPVPVPVQADERIPQLTESVTRLQSEIAQLKDMLLKLQSFTMDTNQKLSDIIFKNNDQDNEVEDGGPLNICSDEDCVNIEHMNNPMMNLMQFIGSRGMPIQFEEGAENFNLKEYIQSELQTSSVTELEPENLVEELSEQ